jgi:predicted transcriptional regulator
MSTVTTPLPGTPLPRATVARIRRLRRDGMSQERVAVLVGCGVNAVRKYAPGRPGKIDNAPVRRIFQEEEARRGLNAHAVAREMEWMAGTVKFDCSRVLRTLGLREHVNGAGVSSTRKMIDAETAERLAEAMGRERWEAHH